MAHIKNPRAKLERERAAALDVFRSLAPIDYGRFRAAEAGLKVLGTPSDQLYADLLKDDLTAVELCLENEDRWMTPREVADALHRGGYRMDPIRGMALLAQNIGKLVIRKKIQSVDGKVGKIDWKHPKTS